MRRRLLEKREEEGVAQEIARFIDRYHEHLDAERVLELFPDDVSFDPSCIRTRHRRSLR